MSVYGDEKEMKRVHEQTNRHDAGRIDRELVLALRDMNCCVTTRTYLLLVDQLFGCVFADQFSILMSPFTVLPIVLLWKLVANARPPQGVLKEAG